MNLNNLFPEDTLPLKEGIVSDLSYKAGYGVGRVVGKGVAGYNAGKEKSLAQQPKTTVSPEPSKELPNAQAQAFANKRKAAAQAAQASMTPAPAKAPAEPAKGTPEYFAAKRDAAAKAAQIDMGRNREVKEAGYGSRNPDLMSPQDYDRYQQDQMDYSKRAFKRREMEHELGDEEEYFRKTQQRDAGTWYIRINGKILKDKQGQPYTFRGKPAANKAALTMMAKPFNKGKEFMLTTSPEDKLPGVTEGAEFGSNYAEQLAQQTFDIKSDLKDENEVLNLGYSIAKRELGARANGVFRDEDFPSDFVSAYGWLQDQRQQGVAEVSLNEYRNALYDFVKSKFPTWPEYVLKDFLYAQAKGIRNEEELKDFLERNQKEFGQVKWRLEKLPITLDIFTPKTQRMIKQRAGGSSNPFQVPRDAERHAQQQKMIQQKGVSQEPIIVAKLSNGYDLIEGWHRTIQNLQAYPNGYTGPAWVAYGATYTSEPKQGVGEAVTLDRSKNPNYPNDPATIQHHIDSAKAILSDPKSDSDSRKAASAILAKHQEGVAEGDYDIRKDPTYQKYNPETHTMMYKDGKHKAVKHDQVAKAKELGWKVRSSLKAFVKGQGGVAEGVATTIPELDAKNYLRKYGAEHFKTTTNELHFYKNGRPFSVDLVLNPDTSRSVTISSLNAARRGLTGQGVAESQEERVGFHLDSERAYQAVMSRFGDMIDHDEDSGIMYAPERLWPKIEQVAHDADGIGAQRDDELDNPEHYGVTESEDVVHRIGLTVTDPNHPMVSKRNETIFKTIRVPGGTQDEAVKRAVAHYRKKGYKVHDFIYKGVADVAEGMAPIVAEGKKPTNTTLWESAQNAAKKKFNVYPTDTTEAWATKWYAIQGGSWE